ncbi:MAG: porin family protein [Rhodospirillales bacterium]
MLRLIRTLFTAGLGLGIVLGLAVPPTHAAEPAPGLEVRTGLHKDFTRLVLETRTPVPYKFAFPGTDEIVVTVTGAALSETAGMPEARGIIRAIEISRDARGSRLSIKTRHPADIRRQFTLLPKDGQGARIVIDLAAAAPAPAPAPAAPKILLPAPHTTITVTPTATGPEPHAEVLPARRKPPRPTQPFEVAAAGGGEMLVDGGPGEALAQPVELARQPLDPQELPPLELAQAGGLSVNDWLMREGGNPNVRPIPPAPAPAATVNPPAPPAYPATPVHSAPMYPVPARGASAYPAAPAYPAYRPAPTPSAYPAPPAAQTHPSHPGYRAAPPAPTWAPPRGQAVAPSGGDSDPAARYASQKQSVPVEDQAPARPQRFYGGLGLGLNMFDYESDNANTTLNNKPFAWKIFGGYRLSDALAFEASVGRIGAFDERFPNGTSGESQFHAFSVSTLVSLPLNKTVKPFARAGVSLWWEDADSSAAVIRQEESGTGAVLGLGADYRFSDRLSLRGEWEIYILSDTAYSNMFAASVLYNF